jgi:hypothetical protein
VLTFVRRAAAVSLIAGGMAAGPIASAGASNTSLRLTVKRDLPRITLSQARILDGAARFQRTHSSKALIRAIRAQNRNLTSLRHRVAGERASNATGARGKSDIIRGLTLIVGSNNTLSKDVARAASHRTVSKRQIAAATLAARRGNRDLARGGRLLKV